MCLVTSEPQALITASKTSHSIELKWNPPRSHRECVHHYEVLPGVNFINILRAVLARADLKSAIKTVKLSAFLVLSESASAKAALRMFDEIDTCLEILNRALLVNNK
jgi:hypothetical protein